MTVRHGMPYAQCFYCGKWVKLAGFFAGIHICTDETARRRTDQLRAQLRAQQQRPKR